MSESYFVERDRCPVCHQTRFNTIFSSPFDESPLKDYLENFYSPQGKIDFEYLKDATYELIECTNCRAILQKNIANDHLMNLIYEIWIDSKLAFTRHLENDDLPLFSSYAQEIMQVLTLFKKSPFKLDFLDFGMGWGKWALMAKAFGCNSYGLEISEMRIKHAKKNGIDIINWDSLEETQFDFINSEQVFEHIPEPLDTLNYLKNALKPGGIIKISVPTGTGIDRRLKHMNWDAQRDSKYALTLVAPLEHINYFRRGSILKMAKKAGMEEIFIPINSQYRFSTCWKGKNRILMNLALPLIRNIFRKQNYIFLKKGN